MLHSVVAGKESVLRTIDLLRYERELFTNNEFAIIGSKWKTKNETNI